MTGRKNRRIIQVLPTLSYGDAVGNEALAIQTILRSAGYEECIYAENIGNLIMKDNIYPIHEWREPNREDIIIYHLSVGWSHIKIIQKANCRKIAIYHNVTPPYFFAPYNSSQYNLCRKGVEEVKYLKDVFDYCFAHSKFSESDLISYGYKCRIDILPILLPMDDYRKEPDKKTISRMRECEGHNIVFVGRIAPNKKQEDIIASFTMYQKYYDHNAKLYLVGAFDQTDLYYRHLSAYVSVLQVKNVYFTGHISFAKILGYYNAADVFVCMSEHEGFCVPIIEAMLFGKPILAYDAGAVGTTLGKGGILVNEKDYLINAGIIDRLINDKVLCSNILRGQREQLATFSYDVVKKQFLDRLRIFLDNS